MATAEEKRDPIALADLSDSLVDAWRVVARQGGAGARPGSQAALDATEAHRELPAAGANEEHAAGYMSGRMVDAIALLLQSVGTQLRAEPLVPLAVWPLVRAELEHAGRVAWLLQPLEGSGAASRRVARAMLEHASALQRDKYTASKHSTPLAKALKRDRDNLLRRIGSLFSDVDTPLDGPEKIVEWRIGGETMLGLGRAIDLFVSLNFTKGSGVYDVLSDRSHPSVTSLASQSVAEESEGVTSWSYPVNPDVLDFQVRLGCLILYKTAHTIASYYGLDASALESWAEEAPAHWLVEDPAAAS